MGDAKMTAEERATELGERLGLGELDGAERARIVVALETHAAAAGAEVAKERDEALAAVERVRAVVFGGDGKIPVLAVGHNHTTRCWADGMNEAMERVRAALAGQAPPPRRERK